MRQVHYRRAGAGPPVLLLHQTPTSSAELIPLMQRLSSTCTVLAPDMPGYGASDPLGQDGLSVPALADNVAAFMDALGLRRAGVYGYHTGASVACSLSSRHPQRVSVAFCEGLLCLTPAERELMLARYVEPWEPRWDGAHLCWLWSRIKDQSVFFPWYERAASARLELDASLTDSLHASAREWLKAGSEYGAAYAAAFRYDPLPDLAAGTVPRYLMAREGDPLREHLQRVPPGCPQLRLDSFASGEGCAEHVRRILDQLPTQAPAPAAPRVRAMPDRVWQDYALVSGLQLRVLRRAGQGAPCLLLHAAQSSLRSCAAPLSRLAPGHCGLAVELPGHGESDALTSAQAEDPGCVAELLRAALRTLSMQGCHGVGIGAGGSLLVEMRRQWKELIATMSLVQPIDVSEEPPLQRALLDSYVAPAAQFHGGHLLRAWHEVRDHLLFFPWFERSRACAGGEPWIDTASIHARTVEMILAGEAGAALRRAELRYPLRQRLHELNEPVVFGAPAWDPRQAHIRRMAGSRWSFVPLPREPAEWLRSLLR
jgi:pimeloyl-ACP methyl ester carboxylesterase